MTRRKPRKPAAVHSDFGPPERHKRGRLILESVEPDMADTTNRDRVRVIADRDPLWVYRKRGVISGRQKLAGMALRGLWVKCGKEPSVVGRYEPWIDAGSVESQRVKNADSHKLFTAALQAVGPIASNEVTSVACIQEFIDWRRYEILRRGLSVLGRFLGC